MSEPNDSDDNRKDRPDGSDSDSNRKGPNNKARPPAGNFLSRGVMGWVVLISMAVLLLFVMTSATRNAKEISAQEFINHAKQHHFEGEVVIHDERMVGELKSDTPGVEKGFRRVARISRETKEYRVRELESLGQSLTERPGSSVWFHVLLSWGPILLIIFLVYFFVFRSFRNAGGGPGGMLGNFGRSRHKVMTKEHSNVTLADVAGINEAKEELGEIIEFLRSPKKFQRLGGRVPRGVLLIGEPGCGKTLLAKAIAGEAEVPFFSISGSDFVEMFVGVGASRVRDLFKQAKDSSPCIIFLDEIDAVGRRRGAGFTTGGHDEREQTLNAILVEMDGFHTNDQIIVIAATNRSDVLDPALTRPGRFDRQIHVPLPDIRGRVEILKVHSRRIKMGPDVELERLARGTSMFTGADLAAIINEAAIAATLQGKDFVEQEDLEEARDKVRWGRARKSQKIEEDERQITAYHEAGHAVMVYFDPDSEPLHKVTIIPRGPMLGVTFLLPEKDRYNHTRRQLLAQLRVTFGGRIAEKMFCDDISTGAAMDIRQATAIARAMVMEFGMSEKLGFQLFGHDESKNFFEQPEKTYSDETAKQIDEEVSALIDQTYQQAHQMLQEHRQQADDLAQALLHYETLDRQDVERIMKGEKLTKTTVQDLLKAEQEKDVSQPKAAPSDIADLDNDTPDVMPSPA